MSKVVPGTDIPMLALEDAIKAADVIVLAVPSRNYLEIVTSYEDCLSGKVLIDISNPSAGEVRKASKAGGSVTAMLQTAAPQTFVAKAFNDIGAYLLLNTPSQTPFSTVAYSDSPVAISALERLTAALNIKLRAVKPLGEVAPVEREQLSAFAAWHLPLFITFLVWVFAITWASVRYIHYSDYLMHNLFLRVFNKSAAWASLWGFALAYLPGACMAVVQVTTAQRALRLPRGLCRWMAMRKELGILALLGALIHTIASAYLSLPAYYPKYFTSAPAVVALPTGSAATKFGTIAGTSSDLLLGPLNARSVAFSVSQIQNVGSILTWSTEVSYFLGIGGTFMGCLVGLSSLPGISHTLNWREWQVAQSWGGWITLVLSTAHALILSVMYWAPTSEWPGGMLGVTILSTSLPMFAIAVKLVGLLLQGGRRFLHLVQSLIAAKNKQPAVQVLRKPSMRNFTENNV